MVLGIGLVLPAVLLGPVLVKPIEENIEIFFLIAGSFASAITGHWSSGLFHAALAEPIALTIAVLVFGVIARILRPTLDRSLTRMIKAVAPRWIYFGRLITLSLRSREI